VAAWTWNSSNDATPEYKELEAGWKTFVKKQKLPNVFWDPIDRRWEQYDLAEWTSMRSPVPNVDINTYLESSILQEVFEISKTVRALGGRVFWNPRDGYWYSFFEKTQPKPAPPPEPDWVKQMNDEIRAIALNPNLTPEEKQRARMAIVDAYTSGRINQ
jgi:hypothetical protein